MNLGQPMTYKTKTKSEPSGKSTLMFQVRDAIRLAINICFPLHEYDYPAFRWPMVRQKSSFAGRSPIIEMAKTFFSFLEGSNYR